MDKKKILIVDDQKDFLRVTKLNLEQTGKYEVMAEHNATKALKIAYDFKPDLIILDVYMPEIDGIDLAKIFKSDKNLKNIPIIYLTALATRRDVVEKHGYVGAYPFLSKPVSKRELIVCIEENLK